MKEGGSQSPSTTADPQAPAARPARGRRMISEKNAAAAANAEKRASEPTPKPASPTNNGWGHVHSDPWGGKSTGAPSMKGDNDAKSAASGNGWGYVRSDPWGGMSTRAPSVKSGDDAESVASGNGWGHIRSDPWGGKSVGTPSVKDDDGKSAAGSTKRQAANKNKGKKPMKSWADQMEDDDKQSLASSDIAR